MIKKIFDKIILVIIIFSFSVHLFANDFNSSQTKLQLPSQLDLRENFVINLGNVDFKEESAILNQIRVLIFNKYWNSSKNGFIGYFVLNGKRFSVYKNNGEIIIQDKISAELEKIIPLRALNKFLNAGISQEALLAYCKIFGLTNMDHPSVLKMVNEQDKLTQVLEIAFGNRDFEEKIDFLSKLVRDENIFDREAVDKSKFKLKYDSPYFVVEEVEEQVKNLRHIRKTIKSAKDLLVDFYESIVKDKATDEDIEKIQSYYDQLRVEAKDDFRNKLLILKCIAIVLAQQDFTEQEKNSLCDIFYKMASDREIIEIGFLRQQIYLMYPDIVNGIDWNKELEQLKKFELDVIFSNQARYEEMIQLQNMVGNKFFRDHIKETIKFVQNHPKGIDEGIASLLEIVRSKINTSLNEKIERYERLQDFFLAELQPNAEIIYSAGIFKISLDFYLMVENGKRKASLRFEENNFNAAVKKLTQKFLTQYPQYTPIDSFIEEFIDDTLLLLFEIEQNQTQGPSFFVEMCKRDKRERQRYCNTHIGEFSDITDILKSEKNLLVDKILPVNFKDLINKMQGYVLDNLDNPQAYMYQLAERNGEQILDKMVEDFMTKNDLDMLNEQLKVFVRNIMSKFLTKFYSQNSVFSPFKNKNKKLSRSVSSESLSTLEDELGLVYESEVNRIFDSIKKEQYEFLQTIFQEGEELLNTLDIKLSINLASILRELDKMQIVSKNDSVFEEVLNLLLAINRSNAELKKLNYIDLRLNAKLFQAV